MIPKPPCNLKAKIGMGVRERKDTGVGLRERKDMGVGLREKAGDFTPKWSRL